jgi:hypothetical protein
MTNILLLVAEDRRNRQLFTSLLHSLTTGPVRISAKPIHELQIELRALDLSAMRNGFHERHILNLIWGKEISENGG